jgi:TRAP-type C4-dicarboxylate transport system substrate-binding protein
MRMPSPIHTAWANSVGAASINVPSSDMYSGLEKGQLDCAVNALNDLKSRSLWDVAKHATRLSFGPYFAGWQYAIDQGTWIGLSEPHRRLMLDAISDNSVDLMIAYQATVDEAIAEAQSNGVTVSEPSVELQASLDTFVKENSLRIASETGAQLGAQDPEGIVSRFGETYAKWEKLLADTPREDVEALKNIFRTELYNKIDAASYGQK